MALSANYHLPNTYYRSKTDPSLMPIYNQLKQGGINLIVDSGQMIPGDLGYKVSDLPSGASFYGGYYPDTKKFIMSSDKSSDWWHHVPHEYAHYVTETQKPQLKNELPKYFKDREDMADSYADYYNDPQKFAKQYPTQTQWFQSNFVTPPQPIEKPKVQQKKSAIAKKML